MTDPATHDTVQPIARRRAALAFIFVTVLIDIMSFGLIIPVLPHLIRSFLGGDVAAAARWYMGFAMVFMAMQFVFTPIQGTLSDRFGRRPVILLSNLGLGVDFLFMAMANTLPLLFIGRVVSGITSASFSTANAYVADITPPEKRAQAFGMIGMAFGIGFIIAPAIGGHLGAVWPRGPFWVAAVLALTNFCYGYFVLPESLPPEKRTSKFDWSHANPFGALKLLRRYSQVWGLIAVLTLIALAHMVYPTTFVLYAKYRFDWDEDMAGNTLALVGVLAVIVQGGLIKKIVAALGERRALLFGLACGTLGFVLYGLAPTGYIFWMMMPVAAFWGVANPAAQAIMTHQVDPREQGRLQGAATSMASIAGIVGAGLFPMILAAVADAKRHDAVAGATFFVAAAIVGAAFVLAWYLVTHLPIQKGATQAPTPTVQEIGIASEIVVGTELAEPATESESRA